MTKPLFQLLLILAPAVCLAAGTPTIDQSLSLKTVANAQISPDGKYVAWVETETNWSENEFVTQIRVANAATGESWPVTHAKKSSMEPTWSPDGQRMAFVSERDGKRQIFVIALAGGEAAALTQEETGVGAIAWSPDGRWIGFTGTGPEAKGRKDRKEKYGEFEVFKEDYAMNRLWRVAVPKEIPADVKQLPKPELLTEGAAFSVGAFSWSPDSAHLAFSATKDPDLGSSATAQIYVLDVADRHVRKLLEGGGPNTNPKWSPDGRQIAFVSALGVQYYSYANRYVETVAMEGGTPKVVTKALDEDAILLDWGPDGIYFGALQKTDAHVFRVNPADGAIKKLTGPEHFHVTAATFTRDHKAMAATGAGPNRFADVLVSAVGDFAPKWLTTTGEQWKDMTLATKEVVQWKSGDGAAVEGVLIKPANFDPKKKYPLLVVIHGGPTGVDTAVLAADRYYPVERFVAKGALVLKPNYRGSAGYGAAFRALNVRNLGVGDYADVISGVDALVAKGFVDRDRVGAMGWSEGGYISAFITTYSDRFRAVSVGAGISDWMTYYVNTDIDPFTRQYLKATPWEDPEIYRKTSPITYINQAKTPTLIQHGDQDKRVPPPNAFELYRGLKDRNVPVKLVLYKGFGHPITKPKQQRALMEENFSWFSRYVWGEEVGAPSGN